MMKRTALARVGAVVVLAAGVATGAATTPAAAAPPLSAGLVPAMTAEFGLTAEQARERLRHERTAATVEPAARAAAGAAYGGSWYDAERGTLVVGVTDPAVAAAVEATGARTQPAKTSAARLDAAKEALDRLTAPAGVTSWRADPRAGSVVVTVNREDADTARFLARAREAGPVTVHRGLRPSTFSAGTVGGDPYYINGNTRCSIGFSVHGYGFISAGHCGGAGSQVTGWDGSHMGSFAGSSFPGNDYSYIRVTNGWWTVPVVLGWGQVPDQLVRGSWEAPVGSSVCRSGSTTRWHCGTVLAKNETVNYAQGAFYGATKTSVCAEGGDSGGSFITGDQAQGVTSGGWGNCRTGGETWFQPVNEILQTYGLALHTA